MSSSPSRLELTPGDDGSSLAATGVIDSHTADDLLAHLQSLGHDRDVTLDLGGVEFIDSSGLRSIIVYNQELVDAGHALVLADPSAATMRLLEITGLADHFRTA